VLLAGCVHLVLEVLLVDVLVLAGYDQWGRHDCKAVHLVGKGGGQLAGVLVLVRGQGGVPEIFLGVES
jgi:hypothetical protein